MKKLFGLSLLSLFSAVVFAEPLKEYTKEDIIVEEYSLTAMDRNGVPLTGVLKDYYENGKLKEETSYINGERDGISREYYENGQLESEALYKNGYFANKRKIYLEDGSIIEDINENEDGWDGYSKSWYFENPKQLHTETSFRSGNGYGKQWYKNGQLRTEVYFKDKKINGLATKYYENGNIRRQVNIVDGIIEGEKKEYYENGKTRSVLFFKNGVLDGEAKYYHEDGSMYKIQKYDNGKPIARNSEENPTTELRSMKEYVSDFLLEKD